MKKCPNCGTKNADSATHCNFCDTNFPETESRVKKETEYVHNSVAEKKKAKKRKIIVIVVVILVLSALAGLSAVIFSGDKTTKSEEITEMMLTAFEEGAKISGTLKGKTADLTFTATVEKDGIIVLINGGEYDSVFISKEKMFLEKDREEVRETVEVTEDMEEYKLYVAYLTISSIIESEKNILNYETKDIKNSLLPIVKEKLTKDFDGTFIEDNFISAIASVLMIFESEPDLETYMGITLPEDVKNAEIAFDVASYDLQNKTLSQFKKSYKDQTDYDAVNQALKDAKSTVKNSYKATGSFKTENGKLVSAKADITYDGYGFELTLTFE